MYRLQFFTALVVGTSLGCATASEARRTEANTCTVLKCGSPGRDGLPGRDGRDGAKGEKGDQATNDLQNQVTALENKLEALQAAFNKYKNAMLLQRIKVGWKTFFSTRQSSTFANGRSLCADAGAAMAAPKNAEENDALHELTKRDNNNAFLDISDIQREGVFAYADGTPVGYTNWEPGEPNNANNSEDCATILAGSGQWNDYSCDQRILIICEF